MLAYTTSSWKALIVRVCGYVIRTLLKPIIWRCCIGIMSSFAAVLDEWLRIIMSCTENRFGWGKAQKPFGIDIVLGKSNCLHLL